MTEFSGFGPVGPTRGSTNESLLGEANEINRKAHINTDVDSSTDAQHHTLGTGALQAAPGNHSHGDDYASLTHTHPDLEKRPVLSGGPFTNNASAVYNNSGSNATLALTPFLYITTQIDYADFTMASVTLEGYNYTGTNSDIDINISFYTFNTGITTTAVINKSRFMFNYIAIASNTQNKIVLILRPVVDWNYPKLIARCLLGHAGSNDAATMGWSMTLSSGIAGVSNLVDVTSQQRYLTDDLHNHNNAIAPSGSAMFWFAYAPPPGWLLLRGQAISRPIANGGTENTYAALWALWGTFYGAGNGSSTFNVPNPTNRFIRVAADDAGLAAIGGASTVTLTAANLPPHQHSMSHTHGPGSYSISRRSGTGTAAGAATGSSTLNGEANVSGTSDGPSTPNTGTGSDLGLNSTAVNILNPYFGANMIVKI